MEYSLADAHEVSEVYPPSPPALDIIPSCRDRDAIGSSAWKVITFRLTQAWTRPEPPGLSNSSHDLLYDIGTETYNYRTEYTLIFPM